MTTPGQLPPDGAMVSGTVSQAQSVSESQIRSILRLGGLSPWENAQSGLSLNFTKQETTWREVTRLDNRIDMLLNDNQLVQLATYSTSDMWTKPLGAVQVTVHLIPGGTSGFPSSAQGSDMVAGGYNGAYERMTFDAADLPDTVPITIGSGGSQAAGGGTIQNGGATSFGTFLTAAGATGAGFAESSTVGDGYLKVRGGNGGYLTSGGIVVIHNPGTPGGSGTFHPGGLAGSPDTGQPGENGHSITEIGQIGYGSAGGGGGTSGGAGGAGGWPGAPGGGGARRALIFNPIGPGGAGGSGAAWIMTTLEDPYGSPPSKPTGLQAAAITFTSVVLQWTASTDDVAVAIYEILNAADTVVGQTTGVEHPLVGLTPYTSYTFRVRAVDLGGNRSEPSDPITFTTDPE